MSSILIVPYVAATHVGDLLMNDAAIFDRTVFITYDREQFEMMSGWVAIEKETVVGYCLYRVDDVKEWYFAYLAVLPECQGRGIGTELLNMLLENADTNRIHLTCHASTVKAKEWYERHGFNVASTGVGKYLVFLKRRPARLKK